MDSAIMTGVEPGPKLFHLFVPVGGQKDDLILDLGSVIFFVPVQREVHVKNEAADVGRQGVGYHEC